MRRRKICDLGAGKLSQESVRYAAPLLCLLLMGCGPRPSAHPKATPSPKPSPSPFPVTVESAASKTVISDGKGNRVLEFVGKHTSLPTGGNSVILEGTRVVLYKDGKPTLSVAAGTILVEVLQRKLSAKGGVSASTLGEAVTKRFHCDTLTWQHDQQHLFGMGHVEASSGDEFSIAGSQLTADTPLKTLEILP